MFVLYSLLVAWSHDMAEPLQLRTSLAERLSAERELPVSTLARIRRTAATALGGGQLLVDRVLSRPTDARTMASIVSPLAELKGLAMKMGQMLSYMDASVPQPTRAALSVLQTQAHPLPFQQIRAVIERGLRDRAAGLLDRLEPKPLSVASIGQVHRSTLEDGTPVAVKVQYPQIERAIDDDFGPASFGSAFAGFFYPNAKLFAREAKSRFLGECDYRREARHQERFRELFCEHDTIYVPHVHPNYSSRRVLTSDLVEGVHLEEFLSTNPDQDERDRLGQALYDFYIGSIFQHEIYNCDPHPGNYLFCPDGRIALLDFGCCAELQPGFVRGLARLTRAVHAGDDEGLYRAMVELGIITSEQAYDPEIVRRLMHAFCGLLRDEATVFEQNATSRIRETLRSTWQLAHLSLPGEFLFLMRLRLGVTAVLARLGARANWYRSEQEYLEHRAGKDEVQPHAFDLVLLAVGPAPIQVIREIRAATGLDLRATRTLVEDGSGVILESVAKKVAVALRDKLEAAGSTVEIRPSS